MSFVAQIHAICAHYMSPLHAPTTQIHLWTSSISEEELLKFGHLDDDNDGHELWLKAIPSLWRIKQWKDIDWQILVESSKNGIE
jgi:hypothetical protein